MSVSLPKEIIRAEELSFTPGKPKTDEEKDTLLKKMDEAIGLYKKALFESGSEEIKIRVFLSLAKHIPEESIEIITKWRDMIGFVSGKELERMIKMLITLAKCTELNTHERMACSMVLYNRGYIGECYECFSSIASDKGANVEYKVDACRFLYASQKDKEKEESQEYLLEVIEDSSLPSSYRYKVIISFVSRNDQIRSFMNTSKIVVPYDEEFIYCMQHTFFNLKGNDLRDTILSGQHMLGMRCVPEQEKLEIGVRLLGIAKDTTLEENIRADAADVVQRLGCPEHVDAARDIIVTLGFSAVSVKNANMMSRVKTVYNNSQNVHSVSISESVDRFINKLVRDKSYRLVDFHRVQQEVSNLARTLPITKSESLTVNRALNRIAVDTAVFTNSSATLSEIFIHVWLRIKTKSGDVRTTLESRLIQELIDMGDTCSSGHSSRFVNVLSTIEGELKITFEEQIAANIAGRINARLRVMEEEEQSKIKAGMLREAVEEEALAYEAFINKALVDIRNELYEEFVKAGYVSETDFPSYFDNGSKEWIGYIRIPE